MSRRQAGRPAQTNPPRQAEVKDQGVPRTRKGTGCRHGFWKWCFAEDEGLWPFGVALRGGGFKPAHAAAVTAVRGERCVKRRQLRRRVGVRKMIAGDVSLFNFRCHQNRRVLEPSGQVWRVPADWPGGDRHGGDVRLTCCFRRERGKVHPDTAARSRVAAGRPSSSGNCERLSTVAGCAGGPARSSEEPPVMGGERRGWVIRGWFVWSTGRSPGGTG
jgi:hypothetical protein